MIKIAVVGPESTGKSTMAKHLAEGFGTICVPEYARYYCKDLQNQYSLQDEVNMFYGQLALEDAAMMLAKDDILICDTTIMTIKIWSDYLFGSTPDEVTRTIQEKKYDLYLLMDIDLPWEDDPLRDFPNERSYFLDIWKHELSNLDAKFEVISGLDRERLQRGEEVVKKYLSK